VKKILMAAALVVAFAQAAQADSLPKDFRGTWCYVGEYGGRVQYEYLSPFEGDSCKARDGILKFKADQYEEIESGCRFTAVKAWTDPKKARNTKEMGAPSVRIDSTCDGEGCTWKEQLTAYIEKGTLNVLRRAFKEKCEGS
jgi:hypothetical protein